MPLIPLCLKPITMTLNHKGLTGSVCAKQPVGYNETPCNTPQKKQMTLDLREPGPVWILSIQ